MRPISRCFALPVALIVLLSCGKSSESSTGPSGGFAPTSNTTLTGNVSYPSVDIPAGVTVTFSADAVVTVSGNYTQAGNVSAPCHALTLAVAGNVTITGSVANDCSDPNADGTPLKIVGQTSYALTTATITSSGDVSIVNDPGRSLSASVTSSRAPASGAAVPGIAAQASASGYRCNYSGSTITTTPPKKKKGANGTPTGTNGAAGATKFLNCGYASSGTTGGSMLLAGTTINGGSGGDGGDGTSSSSTPSQGGDGGSAGAISISADNDVTLSGLVTINGGNGGKGGTATSTGAAGNPGVSVTATGGKGGGLKPAGGAAPVTFAAGGALTQSGTLAVVIGSAGAGGAAFANAGNGLPGNPGARGGDATANGGNGGASTPVTMTASGAVTLNGSVTLSGGAGGSGGASNPSPGNGGDGNAAGASGGRGGDAFGRGGTGGVGNPPVAFASAASTGILASLTLNSPGGSGGDANLTNADGGAGVSGCPTGPGGAGGGGGNANGGDGPGGAGSPTGNHGHTTITGFGNGNKGGDGNGPGAGGPAGADNSTVSAGSGAAKTVTNSFIPGAPGALCPGSFSMTVTPPTQTATQGGTGSVHVVITRSGSFTGAVTLTVKDQNSTSRGTGTIAGSSTSTDITFTVPSNATVGANTWTVAGTGTSVPDVSQTFGVTVSQSTSVSASVQYCGSGSMVWAGFINGATGTPQNVPIVNGVATFTMTQSAAIYATTVFTGTTYQTDEFWGSAGDVASWAAGYCNSTRKGSTTQPGIVRGLSVGQFAQATLQSSSAFATQPGMGDLNLTFQNLVSGTSDGFATVSSGAGLQEMLILRNVVIPSSPPTLFDFTNGFTPSQLQVTYATDATRTFSGNTFFWSPTGPLDALIGAFTASGGTGTFSSVPANRMASSDLMVLNMYSSSGDASDVRGVTNYFHTPGNMTVAFPGILNVGISRITTNAPVRLQATGSLPAGLTSSYLLTATQGNNSANWYIASSFPGFGATFNWTTPDWTPAGFQASWGLQPGSSIVAGGYAYGYTGGILPADGAQRSFSGRTISVP